ncbi:MAG: poly-gamma-glutamate synthesis protein (capsule biosynthesis protein) [Parcubacteria bacterium C7867-004]|nr:MAG: poly-gamma-glutamate synthesis protein (capsule biosynthesis protein) [Parcubacteria bacterium C7867-004]
MRKALLLVAIVGLCVAAVLAVHLFKKDLQTVYEGTHYASHMQEHFYGDMASADTVFTPGIKGAIVSHHLLVADHIAQTFASMTNDQVKTVVIIGPDHFSRASGKVSVSRYPYETPWGRVEPDTEVIDGLISARLAEENEYVFEIEHSIGSLAPYVRYHFPNARLVPIVVDRSTSPEDAVKLGTYLAANLDEGALVIASVDFSHHLGTTAADFHDAKSVETVRAFDFASLARLEVDSPASLYAVLTYLEAKGAQRPVMFDTTNSARFLGIPDSDDVTSYLFATFAEGPKESTGAVSMFAAGDLMLGRDVAKKMAQGTDLFERFRGVEGNFLRGFDMFIANLEGPITNSTECQKKELSFSFNPSVTPYLKKNGLTHVTLANNHSNDCFAAGISDTKQNLTEQGIRYVGGGTLAESTRTEKVAGKRIAILGIDRTVQPVAPGLVYAHLRSLEESHDYTIVEVHWGLEYELTESTDQRTLAHGMIDSGADVIIGHHPHVVQPVESYAGKPIFYSLGNFVFDQFGKETNTGMAVGLVLADAAISTYLFPYTINSAHQPDLMEYKEAQAYCSTQDIRIEPFGKDACALRLAR